MNETISNDDILKALSAGRGLLDRNIRPELSSDRPESRAGCGIGRSVAPIVHYDDVALAKSPEEAAIALWRHCMEN